MAENINIDFMPNRKTADIQRVGAVEDYLKLFTDRTKFCFSSVYDDFADMDRRIEYLESFSLATPSSVDLTVENAVILQEKESQQVIHNYTKTHYVKGNSIGYGDVSNNIICNGYSIRANGITDEQYMTRYSKMTFPRSAKIYSSNNVICESATEIEVEAEISGISSGGTKNLVGAFRYTDESGNKKTVILAYQNNYPMSDWAISPYWSDINPPDENFPYGTVRLAFDTQYYNGYWATVSVSNRISVYVPFQSEAEYNAAVGLTNTPIELIKLQDFQYLVPESQIIVDKELSPDSDNTIANSTVAKALELKSDKETVETLSLVVESKADIIELDALSQKVEGKAESSDLTAHTGNTDNPHSVTKEQIGLSKAENKSSAEILSELQIHGRNYIVDSGKPFILEGKGLETSATKNVQYPDIETAESLDGKTVTISFDYENNVTEGQCDFRRTLSWGLILRFTPEQNVGKGSHKLTFTIGDYEHTNTAAVYLQGAFSGTVTIKNLKLELGDKATDWSVAPEDVVRLEQRVATLEAAMLGANID
ncbi:MAG: hypothetical protein IJZ51_05560 [Ruminiclostridium sp.]|nr:hypothetical protein [Ruminiclostridium sp.]